jgi:hypothetical protein
MDVQKEMFSKSKRGKKKKEEITLNEIPFGLGIFHANQRGSNDARKKKWMSR